MPQSLLAQELEQIPDRVAAGVRLLTSRSANWRDHINVETLNQGSSTRCVLSQTLGPWLDVTLSRSGYVANGFLAPDGLTGFYPEPFDMRDGYYHALTNEWLKHC